MEYHSGSREQERPILAHWLNFANEHSTRLVDHVTAIAGAGESSNILVQLLAVARGTLNEQDEIDRESTATPEGVCLDATAEQAVTHLHRTHGPR